jgi:hypothetical protein
MNQSFSSEFDDHLKCTNGTLWYSRSATGEDPYFNPWEGCIDPSLATALPSKDFTIAYAPEHVSYTNGHERGR